jgi:glyoxylase-like metal-dependent hydrolase (beta-lactamase superfamily II)
VRYLVNTHWHYDHQIGNGEYAAAFPGLQIVAHTETRKLIRDYNPGWFAKYGELTARIKKTLDTGIRSNGQALTAEQRPGLEQSLAGRGPVAEEFKTHPGRVPDVTFDHELTVDLGHREVRLLHPGRGDTAGDVVVFVPKERVLATGDLLTSPIPYVGGGFTSEEAETLQKLILLDAAITIPGHGEVLRGEAGPARMKLFRDFLVEAWAGVNEAVKRLGSNPADFEKINAEVEKIVDFNAWRQKFAGDSKADQDFFDGFPRKGVVQAAYAEIWPR